MKNVKRLAVFQLLLIEVTYSIDSLLTLSLLTDKHVARILQVAL